MDLVGASSGVGVVFKRLNLGELRFEGDHSVSRAPITPFLNPTMAQVLAAGHTASQPSGRVEGKKRLEAHVLGCHQWIKTRNNAPYHFLNFRILRINKIPIWIALRFVGHV